MSRWLHAVVVALVAPLAMLFVAACVIVQDLGSTGDGGTALDDGATSDGSRANGEGGAEGDASDTAPDGQTASDSPSGLSNALPTRLLLHERRAMPDAALPR